MILGHHFRWARLLRHVFRICCMLNKSFLVVIWFASHFLAVEHGGERFSRAACGDCNCLRCGHCTRFSKYSAGVGGLRYLIAVTRGQCLAWNEKMWNIVTNCRHCKSHEKIYIQLCVCVGLSQYIYNCFLAGDVALYSLSLFLSLFLLEFSNILFSFGNMLFLICKVYFFLIVCFFYFAALQLRSHSLSWCLRRRFAKQIY